MLDTLHDTSNSLYALMEPVIYHRDQKICICACCYAWGRPYTTHKSQNFMHACMKSVQITENSHTLSHTHAFGTTQAQFIAIAAQPSADRQTDPNRMNMQDWKIYAQNFTHYSCFPSFHGVYLCSCRMFYVCWMERNPPFVCEASGSRTRYIVQQQSSKEKRWAWNNTASKQSKAQHITSSESEYNTLSERCAAW